MDEPGRIFADKTEIFGKYRKRNWSLGLQSEERYVRRRKACACGF